MKTPSATVVAVLVAALGYFVDIYDLVLFSVVRVPSLRDLGLSDEEILREGVHLLNMQMVGMLVGGMLWGILGDKKGRLSVLFGSIFLYSAANIANAFVTSVEWYALLRFIAGIGLAGELGAGITLVAEMMPQEKRGYGTTIIATVGVSGALVAAWTANLYDWRTAYVVGGVMGFALLILRVSVHESGMFQALQEKRVEQGNLLLLFGSKERVFRYVCCIGVGLPVWFVVGILMTFSPELGRALGMSEIPEAGKAVGYCYFGLVLGDLGSGLLSQGLKSRKKSIGIFLIMNCIFTALYLNSNSLSASEFYLLCIPLGISVGYWAVFVTTAAEQFGTNLRATVATSVPNFVRGSTALFTLLFQSLTPFLGPVHSAYSVYAFSAVIAFTALYFLRESFHQDLDYVES